MIDLVINALGARVLLFVSVGLLVVCIIMGAAVEIQGSRLQAARADNTTQKIKIQSMGKQITAQNSAVDQMLANAAAQHDRLQAALIRAAQVEVVTKERIRYVETAAIPTACPEAIAWGAEHAREIGRRWEGKQ